MDERMNSVTRFQQSIKIADVTLKNFVVALGAQWLNVKEPKSEMFPQQRHDLRADTSARAGNQNSFAHLSAVGGSRVSRPAGPYLAVQPPSIRMSVPVMK